MPKTLPSELTHSGWFALLLVLEMIRRTTYRALHGLPFPSHAILTTEANVLGYTTVRHADGATPWGIMHCDGFLRGLSGTYFNRTKDPLKAVTNC